MFTCHIKILKLGFSFCINVYLYIVPIHSKLHVIASTCKYKILLKIVLLWQNIQIHLNGIFNVKVMNFYASGLPVP